MYSMATIIVSASILNFVAGSKEETKCSHHRIELYFKQKCKRCIARIIKS